MEENEKPLRADTTGHEVMTNAILELLSQYPGIADGEAILYEELQAESGVAFFADAGAMVMSEKISITDHVRQKCQYPMLIVYRTISTREKQKLRAQQFLDTIGKWICREPVTIDGEEYRLKAYPKLTDGRKITGISRFNSYGTQPQESGVQDWVLPVKVEYTNEFDKW